MFLLTHERHSVVSGMLEGENERDVVTVKNLSA